MEGCGTRERRRRGTDSNTEKEGGGSGDADDGDVFVVFSVFGTQRVGVGLFRCYGRSQRRAYGAAGRGRQLLDLCVQTSDHPLHRLAPLKTTRTKQSPDYYQCCHSYLEKVIRY